MNGRKARQRRRERRAAHAVITKNASEPQSLRGRIVALRQERDAKLGEISTKARKEIDVILRERYDRAKAERKRIDKILEKASEQRVEVRIEFGARLDEIKEQLAAA